MGGLDIHVLRRGMAYARLAGSMDEGHGRRRDYFQEGEALCREGRLNTTAAMSPGKLVSVTLRSLHTVSSGNGGGGWRRGSVNFSGSTGSLNSTDQRKATGGSEGKKGNELLWYTDRYY